MSPEMEWKEKADEMNVSGSGADSLFTKSEMRMLRSAEVMAVGQAGCRVGGSACWTRRKE
jgi:hypothetical protein